MTKNGVIVFCLIISLVANAYLLKTYFDDKHRQVTLETTIMMNEMIEREKALRNLRSFVGELAAQVDEQHPISKEQASRYGLLAFSTSSVIPKATYEIQADYEHYKDYLSFIQEFDREFGAIGNHFKSRLPLMAKEQLAAFAARLNETYNLLMDEALRGWEIRRNDKKVAIKFNPPIEVLSQVLQELVLIREELEDLEGNGEMP